jgi:hypothetical protein
MAIAVVVQPGLGIFVLALKAQGLLGLPLLVAQDSAPGFVAGGPHALACAVGELLGRAQVVAVVVVDLIAGGALLQAALFELRCCGRAERWELIKNKTDTTCDRNRLCGSVNTAPVGYESI